MTWEMKIIFNNVLLMCLHMKNFSSAFYIIFGLASGWSFTLIILSHIQVKFCLTVTNHPKSILYNTSKKLFCMYWDAFCEDSTSFSRTFDITDFAVTAQNVWYFLRRTKLVSSFIKETYKNIILWFLFEWVIPFLK